MPQVKVYYQPDLSPAEWEKTWLPSFGVFAIKSVAKIGFPENEILRFEGDAIEEPTFVDGLLVTYQPKPQYRKAAGKPKHIAANLVAMLLLLSVALLSCDNKSYHERSIAEWSKYAAVKQHTDSMEFANQMFILNQKPKLTSRNVIETDTTIQIVNGEAILIIKDSLIVIHP